MGQNDRAATASQGVAYAACSTARRPEGHRDGVDGKAGKEPARLNAMGEKQMRSSFLRTALASVVALCASGIAASAAWEPVRPVEFIVPAGTGGGADQMARTIQESSPSII